MDEPPLELRRKMLTEKYHVHLSRVKNHPLKPNIQPCWQFEKLKNKKVRQPFGLRIKNEKIIESITEKVIPLPIPPWHKLHSPNIH